MARLLRAALVLPTLVLAHQLVFLARYGSIYGEALAHAGHGQAWTDAVAAVAVGSVVLAIAATAGTVRLAREVRRRSRPSAVLAPALRDVADIARRFLTTATWLTAIVAVGLTIQENIEHALAGLGMPGVGILLSPEYPFALEIVTGVALAIALVATLLGWRRAVLSARLRALADAAGFPRPARAVSRPIADSGHPQRGAIARQLGLRAPPARLPA